MNPLVAVSGLVSFQAVFVQPVFVQPTSFERASSLRHAHVLHRPAQTMRRLAHMVRTAAMSLAVLAAPVLALLLAPLACSDSAVGSAHAREPTAPVELVVWQRSFSGSIGEKAIEVSRLARIGAQLNGQYCYDRCDATRPAIGLNGRWENGIAVLDESVPDAKGARKITGRWRLQTRQTPWRGEWRSADGKRRFPIVLKESASVAFDDDIRVLAEYPPDGESDSCESQSPRVLEIRIYREGRLRQTLQTDSTGTCGMFLPELADMNFDGRPDLSIALMLPAGPNIPHQSWLYGPKRDRFVDAPATLQDITSPMFDTERKRVYSYWRGSCCSHGVDVYRWNKGELIRVDGAESHFTAVKRGGRLGFVYSTPGYENGRIVFAPRIERETKGTLRLTAGTENEIDFETSPPWSERLKLDIYAADDKGEMVLKSSQPIRWVKRTVGEDTLWCPDLPYFDLDNQRAAREVVEDGDRCTDAKPTP
jgi:hypothetical protein